MTKVITEHKALSNPGIEVMNHVFASDDVVWISWKYGSEKHVPSLRHTIEEVGAYVSAVYRYFDRLRQKAICCDTDSVIYIQPRDEHQLIETRDKLGDICEWWAKELSVQLDRYCKRDGRKKLSLNPGA